MFAILLAVLKRTRLGLDIRAVAQNRAMARSMGIRSDWVDAMTFGLGSGIAGVAGVALSQLTNVGPNLGQSYIIDSFMVVVFGGVGNLWGTFIGGMSMGVVNKLLEPYAGAVLAKIVVLVALDSVHPAAAAGTVPADRTRRGGSMIVHDPCRPRRRGSTRTVDRGGILFLAVLAAVAVLVPLLNRVVPATSAMHLSTYALTLIGKYLCYAMLALAVDLVWGFVGILSLGHAAFFALGGYAMGMYLMRQIGARGVYGNPILPDFMVFLNWKELPWFWLGFNHFWFAVLMMALAPALLALVFGWLAFRSRVTGVYLSIMTQALSYALMLAFFRNDMGFGGNNGFTDFKDILGFDLHEDGTRVALLVVTAVALAASYIACRADRLVAGRTGRQGDSRRGEPHTLSRLSRRVLQALGVRVLGRRRRRGGRPVRAAGGHHQPERVCADQLDRGRHLGGGRRTRHAVRRRGRCGAGELREDVSDGRAARGLALRARRALRAGHHLPAARPHGSRCRPGPKRNERTRNADRWRHRCSRMWCGQTRRWTRSRAGAGPAPRQGALSRQADRQLRRLQGAQRADARRRARRTALHHRTQRRRQDHHDGRHHRQDASRSRHAPGSDRRSICWR